MKFGNKWIEIEIEITRCHDCKTTYDYFPVLLIVLFTGYFLLMGWIAWLSR